MYDGAARAARRGPKHRSCRSRMKFHQPQAGLRRRASVWHSNYPFDLDVRDRSPNRRRNESCGASVTREWPLTLPRAHHPVDATQAGCLEEGRSRWASWPVVRACNAGLGMPWVTRVGQIVLALKTCVDGVTACCQVCLPRPSLCIQLCWQRHRVS